MIKHYDGITDRMMSEIDSISERMSHQGEKGRNNEAILSEFLKHHLPTRYTVSTGKIVGVGGTESGQIDLIIHDRLDTPELIGSHEWRLVPIETVYAVISVKTSLNKTELRDAMKSIESVRSLPRTAAIIQGIGGFQRVPEDKVLRPRALVFGYQSTWKTAESFSNAFTNLLDEFDDDNRPNGVCALNQAFIIRRPYKTETILHSSHPLMHFFIFLVRIIVNRPNLQVDLSQYFTEDYGPAART